MFKISVSGFCSVFSILFLSDITYAQPFPLPDGLHPSSEYYCSASTKEIGENASQTGDLAKIVENGNIYDAALLVANGRLTNEIESFCTVLNTSQIPGGFRITRRCEGEGESSVSRADYGWVGQTDFQTEEGRFKLCAENGKFVQSLNDTPRIIAATARSISSTGGSVKLAANRVSTAPNSGLAFSEITDLQWSLRQLGYYKGRLDGILSADVQAAYQAYQKRNEPDKPSLDRAAIELLGQRQRLTTVSKNLLSTRRAVENTQKALILVGFRLSVTGAMDPTTASSLHRFQQQYGFPATGRLDTFTYDRLLKAAGLWVDVTSPTADRVRHPFADHALAFLHEGLRPVNPVGNTSIYVLGQNQTLPLANNTTAATSNNASTAAPGPNTVVASRQSLSGQQGQLDFRQLGGLQGLRMRGDSVVVFNKVFNSSSVHQKNWGSVF